MPNYRKQSNATINESTHSVVDRTIDGIIAARLLGNSRKAARLQRNLNRQVLTLLQHPEHTETQKIVSRYLSTKHRAAFQAEAAKPNHKMTGTVVKWLRVLAEKVNKGDIQKSEQGQFVIA
mgnify:CR=1 FL=1